MEGLTEGRIVHYVLNEQDAEVLNAYGRGVGEHRAAIIVQVWDSHRSRGTVNLSVFLDGSNDDSKNHPPQSTVWRPSTPYSEEPKPGTWHWIEKA